MLLQDILSIIAFLLFIWSCFRWYKIHKRDRSFTARAAVEATVERFSSLPYSDIKSEVKHIDYPVDDKKITITIDVVTFSEAENEVTVRADVDCRGTVTSFSRKIRCLNVNGNTVITNTAGF